MSRDEELESLVRIAFECGLELHRELGPGLLESVYETLMFESLRREGLRVERQVPVRIEFRGIVIENAFRADLLVEGRLLIELKSVEANAKVHAKQLMTYLRLMKLPLGLLMNFGLDRFTDGFQRLGNGYFAPPR
jgi:iron complex transport system substrate-binding protein